MSSSAEHLASGVGEVHAGGLAWRLDGRLLGQGGFASVYAAVASDGTTAAVKLIDTRRLSAWATRQLEGEVAALERAQAHRHVIGYRGRARYGPFELIFLEMCTGGDLLEQVLQHGGLPEAAVREVITSLLDALVWLHAKDICHGCAPAPAARACARRELRGPSARRIWADLPDEPLWIPPSLRSARPRADRRPARARPRSDVKPENVMCGSAPGDIKLADFGSASRLPLAAGALPSARHVGTTLYSPPEVLQAKAYGASADLWALGITCYVLVSGCFPFSSADEALRCRPSFDEACWRAASPLAQDFIEQLLRHPPGERPTAAGALGHPWLAHSQRFATPPPLEFSSSPSMDALLIAPSTRGAKKRESSEGGPVTPPCKQKRRPRLRDANGTLPPPPAVANNEPPHGVIGGHRLQHPKAMVC